MYNLVFFIKQVPLNRVKTDVQVWNSRCRYADNPLNLLFTDGSIKLWRHEVKVLNFKGQLKIPIMMKLPY